MRGELILGAPTIKQAAALLSVSVPYIHEALSVTASERAQIAAGQMCISELPATALLREWSASKPTARKRFGKLVGADELWKDAVEPALAD